MIKDSLMFIDQLRSRRKLSCSRFFPMKLEKDVRLCGSVHQLRIVANIAVVKPDKAEKLEMILI